MNKDNRCDRVFCAIIDNLFEWYYFIGRRGFFFSKKNTLPINIFENYPVIIIMIDGQPNNHYISLKKIWRIYAKHDNYAKKSINFSTVH